MDFKAWIYYRITIATLHNDQLNEKTIEVVQKLKYLGITLESQLLFKRQLTNTVNRSEVKSSNFRFIRSNLTRVSKILCSGCTSHCVTSWASGCKTTLKSIETVFKQALKVFDRKSKTHHHCQMFKKNMSAWTGSTLLNTLTPSWFTKSPMATHLFARFCKKK